MRRPLSFTPTGPGQAKQPPRRFATLRAIHGHEVIDHDGRPVAEGLPESDAINLADNLNHTAMAGARAVAGAIAGL